MNPSIAHSSSRLYVIRLRPGDDLRKSLHEFAKDNKIKAAVVVTCVGSLVQYSLRFANQKETQTQKGHFEIVSLTGTLSETSVHLHICVSGTDGVCTGGHLLDNNIIYTTAEIAIASLPDLEFKRVFDDASGYHELEVSQLRVK